MSYFELNIFTGFTKITYLYSIMIDYIFIELFDMKNKSEKKNFIENIDSQNLKCHEIS